jgi:mediator of RNA polymerase II transcription subunit 13, fungi type
LKHTERQFHQASILAAIDAEAQQLFTFYKKVDVLKDQRSILTKFGQILRSNSCTISYKAAARAPELFKPENARLYRLFVASILASLRVVADDHRQIHPLGQRYRAVEVINEPGGDITEKPDRWSLARTDLQMILTGQVVLTISSQRLLRPLAILHDTPEQVHGKANLSGAIPVTLAPTGQLAVYQHGWIGQLMGEIPSPNNLSSRNLENLRIWQHIYREWCRRDGHSEPDAQDLWAELIIPVQEQMTLPEVGDQPTPRKPVGSPMAFKTLFWPAKWCFMFDQATRDQPQPNDTIKDYDPVQLLLSWYENINGSDYGLEKAQNDKKPADDDDGPLYADESVFENAESFQPFGPPAFPASQTVYPTPPDVLMTHHTPAMSSVDGMAATPSALSRNVPEQVAAQPTQPMETDDPVAAPEAASGLYDEDLFEDMPDDVFGETNGADEPNWDFFDKPNTEGDDAAAVNAEDGDDMDIDESPSLVLSNGDKVASTKDAEASVSNPDDDRAIDASFPRSHEVDMDIKSDDAKAAQSREHSAVSLSPVEARSAPSLGHERPTNRRASAYDAVARPVASPNRDRRYTAAGSFYFPINATAAREAPTKDLGSWIKRSPSVSSTSDSESSGYETPFDFDSPLDYKGNTPGQSRESSELEVVREGVSIEERETLQNDARVVLDLLSMQHTRSTLDDAVMLSRPHGLVPQFDKPNIRNGFAHEIVHQMTQSCLLHNTYGSATLEIDGASRNDLSLSMNSLADSLSFSSLFQLCSLATSSANKKNCGRTTKLPEPEVQFKRLEEQVMARPNILSFWDTLGLEPFPNSEDVTAFCLHPYGPGIAESCRHFLDRVADAYNSCGLGQHVNGTITGLTSDGLLEAEPNDQGIFLGPVRRLGEALAKPSQPGGTVVVYLVAHTDTDAGYVNSSIASYAIRRHVEQGWAKRSEHLNLVFQVIPPNFVRSSHQVVVPAQRDFNALAFGVFSRIPPADPESPLGMCHYPLVLPEGRDGVKFGLSSATTSPMTRDGMCLHVAYSLSDDRRWLVAAWTDKRGALAFAIPYQIKTHSLGQARPLEEIIRDIWTVSGEVMAKQRDRWRLVISRAGTYEAPEVNAWMALANAAAKDARSKCVLYLLAVEMKPAFRIFTQAEQVRSGQQVYGTPASTPQGGITSPEQLVAATPTPGGPSGWNAATPPEHGFDPSTDTDVQLVDPREESWSVILPFGMNQSRDIQEMRPAVASGYLVKRTGRKEEDGVTMLGIHMVWPTPDPAGHVGQREDEIEEFISDFRSLATLAAVRGCIDPVTSCAPWHLHTAVSGATALGRLI